MAEVLAWHLLILLVLLLLVGPLMARARDVAHQTQRSSIATRRARRWHRAGTAPHRRNARPSAPPTRLTALPTPSPPRADAVSPVALAAPVAAPFMGEEASTIDVERIEGRVKASSVRKVEAIIDSNPREAAAVISAWLHEERP